MKITGKRCGVAHRKILKNHRFQGGGVLKAITQHVWQRGLKQTSVFLWNQSAFSWRSKQILIWEERGNWLSLENEVLAKKQEYNPRQKYLLKVSRIWSNSYLSDCLIQFYHSFIYHNLCRSTFQIANFDWLLKLELD